MSAARLSGAAWNRRSKCSFAESHASNVSAFSMSPICWLTNASSPRSRQNVFFCSGPAANNTRFAWSPSWPPFFASEIGMGANPRARRTICTASPALPAEITRTTESSKRQRMGRLLPRNASAMPASWERASPSVMQMGSSCRLPDVMTSGPPNAASSRCCTGVYGSMTPSSGRWSARPAANCASSRFFKSTMGRCVPVSKRRSASLTWQVSRTSSSVRYITANALPSRRLRRRSSARASGLRASHAKWKPPRPFTATMAPSCKSSAARAKIASLA